MILGQYGHGGDIYRNRVTLDFSISVNPLGTPRAVREAVRHAADALSAYPDPYCGALREALGRKLGTRPEHILCANGAAELIFQFALALRSAHALLPVPSFSEYETALRSAGCSITFYPLERRDGFALTEAILSAITPATGLLVLCNPNNPTGRVIAPALLEAILKRCRETETWLLLDECFYELTDAQAACSALPRLREDARVFVLRAFTKLYGMAGVRLGYGICPREELLREMCRFCQPWNVSVPAQAAGLAALECDGFVEQSRALIRTERAFLERELSRLGIPFLPGQANYLLLSGKADWGEKLLKQGILIRSCGNFRGLRDTDYRVAVRAREENAALLRALRRLKETCHEP